MSEATFSEKMTNSGKIDVLLKIVKIAVIVFTGIYLLGNFNPYFEGEDAYLYGIVSKNLADGTFSITNELLQKYERAEFVGGNWLKTIHNTAVPASGIGLSILGSLFYLVGGEYGLFYLSPILTILLLIITERISTNLFGKYVGFLTLLILATSNLLIRNTVRLQTESFFSLLIILGAFFLIMYLKNKRDYSLLIVTIFLTYSALIRINGFIFFPIEIAIVVGYFIFKYKKRKTKNLDNSNSIEQKSRSMILLSKKKMLKASGLILIPWLIFFGSWAYYHEYNFGDPFTNYGVINKLQKYETSPLSLVKFEAQDFENVKYYSKYLLPYQLPAAQNKADENFDNVLGKDWLGIVGLLVLFSTLSISFYTKNKRLEMAVFIIFILGTVWFYSAITTEERALRGAPARFMLPVFTLSSMMISFLVITLLQTNVSKHDKSIQYTVKGLKILLVVVLIIFFILAFYFASPMKSIIDDEKKFKDPQIFADRYPLDMEGLTENSVIIALQLDWAIDYGVIPFSINSGDGVSAESVSLLKEILRDGRDVYIFKNPTEGIEKEFFAKLVKDYNIVFKEYSTTFCKVELNINGDAMTNIDKICLQENRKES